MKHLRESKKPFSQLRIGENGMLESVHSDIRVMATVYHKSGAKSTRQFFIHKAARGVTKPEIAERIKLDLNSSGILDKIEFVMVK